MIFYFYTGLFYTSLRFMFFISVCGRPASSSSHAGRQLVFEGWQLLGTGLHSFFSWVTGAFSSKMLKSLHVNCSATRSGCGEPAQRFLALGAFSEGREVCGLEFFKSVLSNIESVSFLAPGYQEK